MTVRILQGDCRAVMATLPEQSVHCCVTSPPYWGLRDYGVDGQIGLEASVEAWVDEIVSVMREVRRVLRDDGTLWLNLGDSYAGSWGAQISAAQRKASGTGRVPAGSQYKPKDLIGQPWLVAFALRADGWYLRQEIIWCISGGAWVYARTQKGDMPVMVKDLVRLDPATVQVWNGEKWTRVLGWGASNDDSERIELVLRSGERIGCTGGHQWPTQRGNVIARELQIGDTISTCRLPEPEGCERPGYLTNDALWLIGLYLAEGSRSGNASCRQVSLCADEQNWIPRIEAVAKHYGGSCRYKVDDGSLAVRLYGPVLHALIDAYIGGTVAIDKYLKVAAWRLPNEALSALVQGYLDGDGHDDATNGRWRLGFCRNYSLERDLRTLAARLGATLTLNPGHATYQGGEAPTFRGEWRWERSGHWNEKDRGEVVEIRASRARGFWDLAVEDEPHLFALASGVLTHNCKPNPMPESIRDRCTKAHEQIFLLSKSPRYYYDFEAMQEPVNGGAHARRSNSGVGFGHGYEADPKPRQKYKTPDGWDTRTGQGGHGSFHAMGREKGKVAAVGRGAGWRERKLAEAGSGTKQNTSYDAAIGQGALTETRNKRSVWTVPSAPFKEAHFATFPPDLIVPCIGAGCPAYTCGACGAPLTKDHDEQHRSLRLVPEASDDRSARSAPEVLQQVVRVEAHGQASRDHQGLHDHEQGLQGHLLPGASELNEGLLRDGTPAGDGEDAGPTATTDRSGASPGWQQAPQQAEEPGAADEAGARQAAENEDGDDYLPLLRGEGADFSACPSCGAALAEVGIQPGVVLDCFGGAGTTALVADRLQRSAVLCELNPAYIEIARRRIASDAPLFANVEAA